MFFFLCDKDFCLFLDKGTNTLKVANVLFWQSFCPCEDIVEYFSHR